MWLGLIPQILSFLTGLGGTVSSVSKDITSLQMAKEKTKSDKELKEIDAELQVKMAQRDVLVAEAGSRLNAILRAIVAAGPALYVIKYYAIDKVLGSLFGCSKWPDQLHCGYFRTDGLNSDMALVLTAVLGFYFLHATFRNK